LQHGLTTLNRPYKAFFCHISTLATTWKPQKNCILSFLANWRFDSNWENQQSTQGILVSFSIWTTFGGIFHHQTPAVTVPFSSVFIKHITMVEVGLSYLMRL
jgi:hypothetical protein